MKKIFKCICLSTACAAASTVQEGAVKTEGGREEEEEAADEDKSEDAGKTGEFDVLLKNV